jgi:hypothetical protein
MIEYNTSNETNTKSNSVLEPRLIRNKLLQSVDRVNPVWYAALSEQQRAELAAYRIALLNVPQQSGFPDNVVWPSKPSWLG